MLSTIADVRGDARVDLANSLGAFLGYYLVRCRPAESASLRELAKRVAATTGPIKVAGGTSIRF